MQRAHYGQIPSSNLDNCAFARNLCMHTWQEISLMLILFFPPLTVHSHKSFETAQFDARVVEPGKSYGKQQVGEEGSSSHPGSDLKVNQAIHQGKDATDQPKADSLPSEFPAIRPGVAADLKFGGCGSYPNLPWVSTSGSGPNGRTISGVTYKYSPTQIKIVCACHGSHMSPDEFIQHASEENNTPDGGAGLTSLSGSNPAASAQS